MVDMSQAHEAIVQLRNCDEKIVEKARNYLFDMGAITTRVSIRKNKGKLEVDWYINKKNYAKKLLDKLSQEYIGEKQITAKLHTLDKDTGKRIYKITAKFDKFKFNKGDKILFKDQELIVQGLKGNYLVVKKDSQKLNIPLNKLKNYKVLDK